MSSTALPIERSWAANDLKVLVPARICSEDPLTVQTPAQAWSYAAKTKASFSYDVFEITVQVLSGSVGIAVVSVAHDTIDDESLVQPTDEPQEVILLARSPGCRIVVRTGADSVSSVVALHSLVCRPLADRERHEAAERPPLQPVPGWNRYYGTRGMSLAEKVRVRDYECLTAPVELPWVEGLILIIQPRHQLSRAVYVSGLYEPNTALAIRRFLQPGMTFVDVGANTGLLSMLAARWVGPSGHVYSFEPSPREVRRLREHVQRNRLDNVSVIPSAVGEHRGKASLLVADDEYSGLNTTGSAFAYAGVEPLETVSVPVTTLDEASNALGHVDVMKLDIEGAELHALRGAGQLLAHCRPVLVFELFSEALRAHGASVASVEQLLRDHDYDAFAVDDVTAMLVRVAGLAAVNEQNVVAVPRERTTELPLSSS